MLSGSMSQGSRVVEATYGSPVEGGHGWHLHIHALVFSMSALDSGSSRLMNH
jgi:hypothetical protein